MGLASAVFWFGRPSRRIGSGRCEIPAISYWRQLGLAGLRVKNALFPKPRTVGWKTNMSVSDASTMTGAWFPLVGSGPHGPRKPKCGATSSRFQHVSPIIWTRCPS